MNAAVPVIALDHPAALDVARVGRKAANLAHARAAGLPVAPGVVLTTEWATDDLATARQVWRITSHDGARPLVVRPSAAGRDRRPSVDAGALEPVAVVADLNGMLAAVAALRDDDPDGAVLVQPHVPTTWRGVLFADDGDNRRGWQARPVVVAGHGASGTVAGHGASGTVAGHGASGTVAGPEWIAELDHAGRVRDVLSGPAAAGPAADVLARLARLAERVTACFDGPHDLDWIADRDGRLQLLRVRPVVRLRCAQLPAPARPVPVRTDRARTRRSARPELVHLSGRTVDEPAA